MKTTYDKEPLLKQFGELTKQDFDVNPIWVQCHIIDYNEPWYDDTDEETFRPWTKGTPVQPSNAMFLVKSEFTLADGTKHEGFITPQQPEQKNNEPYLDLSILQPYIFVEDGNKVGFWLGCMPPNVIETVKKDNYSLIGKSPEDIFPIVFKIQNGLATGIVDGNIPGLCSLENRQLVVEV
jgi:hypothetical protein